MRQKLVVLALAFAFLAGLPLVAAAHDPETPTGQIEQPEAAPAVDSETAPAGPAELDLEDVLDDGRQEMACYQPACDKYCKQHYGPGSFGFCVGGTCICSV